MDERLEKALDYSNYMVTLNNQKRVLKEKFREQTIFYYNGGQFTITKDLIMWCVWMCDTDNHVDQVIVDDNETPISVTDVTTFLDDIQDLYFKAVNEYHAEYKKLSSNRSVEKLVEYE